MSSQRREDRNSSVIANDDETLAEGSVGDFQLKTLLKVKNLI